MAQRLQTQAGGGRHDGTPWSSEICLGQVQLPTAVQTPLLNARMLCQCVARPAREHEFINMPVCNLCASLHLGQFHGAGHRLHGFASRCATVVQHHSATRSQLWVTVGEITEVIMSIKQHAPVVALDAARQRTACLAQL